MKRTELEKQIYKELDKHLMSHERDLIFEMVENLKKCSGGNQNEQ
jgi:hypothetical protein